MSASIEAVGDSSKQGIAAEGLPLWGAAQSLSAAVSADPAYFMGGCAGSGSVPAPAGWLAWLLFAVAGACLLALGRRAARNG